MRTTLLAVAIALFISVLPVTAQAVIQNYQLNIPRQPLDKALRELSKQTGMQIARFSDVPHDNIPVVGPVSGDMSVEQAIGVLLTSTTLKYKVVNDRTIAVVAPDVGSAADHSTDPAYQLAPSAGADNTEQGNALWARFRMALADQQTIDRSSSETPRGAEKTEVTTEVSSRADRLEEIIVTAQKREERLQDVPLAVSALSGETLEAMGAQSFTDYARSIPGLTFQDAGAGRQTPTIRGVNPTVGAATVGYYIGETPIPVGTMSLQANPALIDINRVEVLRGPQGTLYGSSSLGGTIKLVPQAPNLSRFEGSAKGEAVVIQGADGASPGGRAELVVNVPIVHDTFAVRGAFWYDNVGGFIDRTWTNAGTAGIATGPIAGKVRNLPDEHTWGLRTIALFQPTEQFSLSAMVYVQYQHFDGFSDITGGTSNPNDELVQSLITNTPEPQENQFQLYNLTVKYSLSHFNLLSSTSYSSQKALATEEGASNIQLFPTFFGQPGSDVVVPDNLAAVHTVDYNFTEEARLATSESIAGFDAVVGIFYSKEHIPVHWTPWTPPQYNELMTGNDPASPLYAPDNNLYSQWNTSHVRQMAEFGELTYHLTDALSLTGGVRHYDVSNGTDDSYSGWFACLPNCGSVPNTPIQSTLSSSTRGFVYKGNLSYKLTPDHLLYAQYSEGFRPGQGVGALPPGLNCGPVASATEIQPDSLKNYELGAKTSWLERRLTVNAAVYRINWDNIQQGELLPCGFSVLTNFGSAVIKGTELEVNEQLTHRVSAGLSATYLRTRLQQDNPAMGQHAGDPILAVPHWQYALHAETTFPLLEADDGSLRLDYQYTGSSTTNYFARLSDGSFDPTYEVQVVRLLNLKTAMRHHAWEFALSGTNLLNNTVRQSADPWAFITTTIPGRPRYVVTRPRTFSFSATYQF